jgi:hypothetical protein
MVSSLEQERSTVLKEFHEVEKLESIASELPETATEQARELGEFIATKLVSVPAVPIPTASELLNLSEKTVRHWAHEGVLQRVATKPMRLDPQQLHEVLHLVHDLRAAGKNQELIDAVWRRLQDRALTDRDDFQESLAQLRRGDVVSA